VPRAPAKPIGKRSTQRKRSAAELPIRAGSNGICTRWAISALLVALAAIVYAPVARFGFVNFDDPGNVSEEPHVAAGLTPDSVWWALTAHSMGHWVPLTRLSYLLDHAWCGLDPGVMHVENVALHAAAGVILFLFLADATGAVGCAATVAAVFVVHPMHVESVAWITERRDVLSTPPLLGAMWGYVRYVRGGSPRVRRAWYALAVGLYAVSLLAKAMGMTLPALLLLIDLWPLRRPPPAQRTGWRRLLVEKVPFLALATGAAGMALFAQQSTGAAQSLAAIPLYDRLADGLVTTVIYVAKLLVPIRLSAVYVPPVEGWPAWQVAGSAVFIAGLVRLCVAARRRWPYVTVGLAWFLIALLPVSGIAQSGFQSMADRYSYLPSIGLAVAVVWGVAAAPGREPGSTVANAVRPVESLAPSRRAAGKPSTASREDASDSSAAPANAATSGGTRTGWTARGGPSAGPIAMAVVVAFAVVCRRQVGYWRDARTLFTHAVDVTDHNWFAYSTLGTEAYRAGDYQGAMDWYARSQQGNPRFTPSMDGIADCVAKVDPAKAVGLYLSVLSHDPTDANAYTGMGYAWLTIGRPTAAEVALSRAVRLDPTSAMARKALDAIHAYRAAGGQAPALEPPVPPLPPLPAPPP
jgi:hypothetical protein